MIKSLRFFSYRKTLFTVLYLFGILFSTNGSSLSQAAYSPTGLSGTYVIDATGKGDFLSFTEAVNSLTTNGITGQVKFRVKAGSYHEYFTIPAISGTSATNTITFESYNLDSTSVNLNYDASSSYDNWVVKLDGASHIIFRKLKIQSTGADGNVIYLNDAYDNTFSGNILQTNTSFISSSYAAIWQEQNIYYGCNTYTNNLILGGNYGMYLAGTLASNKTSVIIKNNIIRNFFYCGIYLQEQFAPVLTGNMLQNSSTSPECYGIRLYGCMDSIQILKNRINLNANANYGLFMEDVNDLNHYHSLIANNFISITGSPSNESYGIRSYGSYNHYIINNSIGISTKSSSPTYLFGLESCSDFVLKNNILANFAGGYVFNGYNNSNITFDYNDLYTTGSNLAYWSGSSISDLFSWQSTVSMDFHSVSVNPSFYSATDLHAGSIALDSAGQFTSLVKDDIDGEPRNKVKCDIGADEFTPAKWDAFIDSLFAPVPPCPDVYSNLTVRLNNNGSIPINTIKIKWSVNGITGRPLLFSGSLKKLKDTVITIGSYQFLNGTTYHLKIWTDTIDGHPDANHRNDTFIYSGLKTGISGVYTICTSGCDYKSFGDAVNDLVQKGVCDAVKFRVKPGTYTENINIPPVPGTSATNTVTFESYTLDSASVDLNYASTGNTDYCVVELSGARYITFNKIKIRATTGNYQRVVYLNTGACHNTFSGNIIQAATGKTPTEVIDESNCPGYNLYKNNRISGGWECFHIYGSNQGESFIAIKNNIIKDFFRSGVDLYKQISPSIEGNLIQNYSNSDYCKGIDATYCSDSMHILKNRINLTTNYSSEAVYLENCKGGKNSESLVANNFISLSGSPVNGSNVFNISSSSNLYFLNNNVNNSTKSFYYPSLFHALKDTDILVQNNIFVNTNEGYIYYGDKNKNLNFNYNDLYTKGDVFADWSGTFIKNLDAWKTFTSQDTNSMSVNPFFVSNNDLHVFSPYLDSAGIYSSLVRDDIDGDPRYPPKCDIGADEFPAFKTEGALISIVTPVSACAGVTTDIVVRLQNLGKDVISSTKIKWTVNGKPGMPAYFTGLLKIGQDTDMKIGSSIFNDSIKYILKIWIDTVNGIPDGFRGNDTLCDLNFRTGLNGTYTIGKSGCDFKSFGTADTALIEHSVCGPVKFRVKPGNYMEHILIPEIRGSSALNTITFESYNSDSSSVDLNDTSSCTIDLAGAEYFIFNKLKIRSTGTYGDSTIVLSLGAGHNCFSNNIIQTTRWSQAIVCGYGGNSSFNTFQNNRIEGGYIGIHLTYIYGEANSILHNIILNSEVGIESDNQKNNMISENIIISDSSWQVGYGILLEGSTDSVNILKNRILLRSSDYNEGIHFFISASCGLVANNFISISGKATSDNFGISIGNSKNINILFNSINVNVPKASSSMALDIEGGSDLILKNNILTNFGSGTAIVANSVINLNSDNNDIYAAGKILCMNSGTPCDDLNSWRTIAYSDLHSISVNPLFKSDMDLHVRNPHLDSSGLYFYSVPDDIDNQTRQIHNPDIGADEFSLTGTDAEITELVEAVRPCYGVPYNLKAKITNMALETINNFKLYLSINGNKPTKFNFNVRIKKYGDTILELGYYTFDKGKKYDIRIWIDSVNNRTDKDQKNDTLLVRGFSAMLGGTYTIGKSGRDYSTFNAAINDLIAFGICSPVIFLADTGTYNENLIIPAIAGASSTNTTTFVSAGKDSSKVILDYAPSFNSDCYVVQLIGASYIRFEKMTFRLRSTPDNGVYGNVLFLKNGCCYNVFKNNILQCPEDHYFGSCIKTTATNGSNSNNIFENNRMLNGYYGIYMTGNDPGHDQNNKIIKNTITGFFAEGISITYEEDISILNNVISNGPRDHTCYGIDAQFIYNHSLLIANKLALYTDNAAFGININGHGSIQNEILIADNFISVSGDTGSYSYGLLIQVGDYIKIYSNSILLLSASSSSPCLTMGSRNHNKIQNNILCNLAAGPVISIVDTQLIIPVCNFNDGNTNGSTWGIFGSGIAGDLNSWQKISGFDLNSVGIKPVFLSTVDLHLKNFKQLITKNYLNEVPYDIDGSLRSKSGTAIGADDKPCILVDAGIMGILSPSNINCEGNVPLIARLCNFGLYSINTALIDIKINGVAYKTISFNGHIPPWSDTQFVLTTLKLKPNNPYKISISSRLPNGGNLDVNTDNDGDSLVNFDVIGYPEFKLPLNDTICSGTSAWVNPSVKNRGLINWYETPSGDSVLSEDTIFKTPPLIKSKTYYVEAYSLGRANNLETTTDQAYYNMGNMFDIVAKSNPITIDSFAVHCYSNSGARIPVAVYCKKGSYKSFEFNPAAWSFLGIDTFISKGSDVFNDVSIGHVKIRAGESFAFYITVTDKKYKLYSTENVKEINDDNIRFVPGTQNNYPFNVNGLTNMTWNGRIYYTVYHCNTPILPVEVVIQPKPDVKLGADADLCKGTQKLLDAGHGWGFSYNWQYGTNPVTISDKQAISVDSAGSYHVIVNDKCGNTDQDTIWITVNPHLKVDFMVDKTAACLDSNIFKFKNTSIIDAGSITGFDWDFNDGNHSTDSTPNHSFLTDGKFTIGLKVISSLGCTGYHYNNVVVYPQPVVDFMVNDTSQCLKNNYFIFTNWSSIRNGSITCHWNLGDSTSLTDTNCSHSYQKPGSYLVKLTASSNKSCFSSAEKRMTVKSEPVVNLGKDTSVYDDNQFILDPGSGYDEYLWSTGSILRQLITDSSDYGIGSRLFWVKVTTNGCSAIDTIIITFKIDYNHPVIKVYPNPATTVLNIETTGLKEKIKINLVNLQGKTFNAVELEPYNGRISRQLNISELSSGVYFIKFQNDSVLKIVRWIKE